MQFEDEFFGSPEKIALMKRSASLWSLLKESPRYAYYGRLVALSDPATDTSEILSSLARLQGAGVCYYFPKAEVTELFADLEERGFSTDRHEHYWGGKSAFHASKDVLAKYRTPEDLSIMVLNAETPQTLVAATANLCESCEVMPVPGAIMRGKVLRGINLVATDETGRPVASASSFFIHHPKSLRATDVFWGALATREDRRGEKIALLLGAKAIVHMWENEGARGFITGVRADNSSSHALCNKLGVSATEWVYASCLDAELLGGSSVTK
ncbi:MAG: hypothetical protein WBO29_01000 [Albidovulum sp.]